MPPRHRGPAWAEGECAVSREDELATAGKNPLADWSDDRLVAAAYVRGATPPQAAEVEMMRRLRVSIDKQTASSNDLGIKLWWLNFWLLIFTIAIFALTGTLIWVTLSGGA
jgi:hypothetical protein